MREHINNPNVWKDMQEKLASMNNMPRPQPKTEDRDVQYAQHGQFTGTAVVTPRTS